MAEENPLGENQRDSSRDFSEVSKYSIQSIDQPLSSSSENDKLVTASRACNTRAPSNDLSTGEQSNSIDMQLALPQVSDPSPRRIYWPSKSHYFIYNEDDDDTDDTESLIDHGWSRRILELVGNKTKLMESFSWLSTLGGGYSALGETDRDFSSRAGALSLGQQLKLAELLGDERLRVMCHLFAALASLQMNNRSFCIKYISRVVLPDIRALPYRDRLIENILKHVIFRIRQPQIRAGGNLKISDKTSKRLYD